MVAFGRRPAGERPTREPNAVTDGHLETSAGGRRSAGVIDRAFALRTASELVRIDSRNPALEEGAPGELALARHVEGIVDALGDWQTELIELGDRRANLVATRRGTSPDRSPSLMINVHLDTVGVAGMAAPFSGSREGGRIHGRGAQDTKGGMAAVLSAARALSAADVRLGGDLVLAFVADEEHESLGTRALLETLTTNAAIVIEPTALDVCVAHRGFGVFELRTRGRAAHGGRPDVGIDANLRMGAVLGGLAGLAEEWASRAPHPLLGTPSLHVPLLHGGRHLYVYADECTAHVECRTVPGQDAETVQGELQAILDGVVRGEGAGTDDRAHLVPSVEPVLWRAPYEIDPDRPIVRTVTAAATDVRGAPPRRIGHPWWEDSGLLAEAGIDAVVVGPAGEGLHSDEEWVDGDSIVALADILCRSARAYCGTDARPRTQ